MTDHDKVYFVVFVDMWTSMILQYNFLFSYKSVRSDINSG